MNESLGAKKTPGIAVTSLVLGILGVTCCGLLTGLAAIICGHIARGKIKGEPFRYSGAGIALAGLILGYISIFSTLILPALALPAVTQALVMGQATQKLTNAKQIDLAIQKLGFPVDTGITTAAELKERLVKEGYISEEDLDKLRFDEFEIGNVSGSDPGNTIILRIPPTERNHHTGVIFHKGGDGLIVTPRRPDSEGADAPRDPAYLAP